MNAWHKVRGFHTPHSAFRIGTRLAPALVTAAILLWAAPSAWAANKTWDGGGGADTNASTCANWNNDTCPNDGDSLFFNDANSGNDCNFNLAISPANVKLGVRASDGADSPYTGTVTWAVTNSITTSLVVQSGKFTFNANVTFTDISLGGSAAVVNLNSKTIVVTGSFSGTGTVNCGTTDNTCSAGRVTMTSTGSTTLGGTSNYMFTFYDLFMTGNGGTTTFTGPITAKGAMLCGNGTSHTCDTGTVYDGVTVTGDLTVNGVAGGANAIFNANNTVITAAHLVLTNVLDTTRKGTFNNTAGSYQLKLTGSNVPLIQPLTISTGTFNAQTGYVYYLGTAASSVAGTTYYVLYIGDGTATPVGPFTAAGNVTVTNLFSLSLTGTNRFSLGNKTMTINGQTSMTSGTYQTGTNTNTFGDGSGDDTVTINGTLEIQSDDPSVDIVKQTGTGTWDNYTGTVVYNAASAISKSLLSSLSPYNHLTVNSSGSTYTADGALTVNGDLTITAGTLALGANNLTVGGGDIANAGTLTQAASATTTVKGTSATGLGGAGATTLYHLQVGDGSTATSVPAAGTVTMQGDVNVTAAASFSLNGKTLTINGGDFYGAGTVYCGNGNNTCSAGTVTVSGASEDGKGFGGPNSTFTFYALTISGESQTTTFAGNIETKSTFWCGNTAHTCDTSGNNYSLTVGGQFQMFGPAGGSNAVFYANASTITLTNTVNAGGRFFVGSSVDNTRKGTFCSSANPGNGNCGTATASVITLNSCDTNRILWIMPNSTFTPGTGRVEYAGAGACNGGVTLVTGITYNDLTVGTGSTTATYQLMENGTVGGVLTVADTAGNTNTMKLNAKTLTLSGTGTPLVLNGETLDGTTGGNGTVTYTGGGTTTVTASTGYGHLTSNGTGPFNAGGTITAGGTLTAQSGTFEVGANTVTAANVTVSGGTLSFGPASSGGKLKISGNGDLTMSSGSFVTSDVATPVELTSNDTDASPTYVGVSLTGGTLNVAELDVDYLKNTGFVIGSSVTVTNFNKVRWGGSGGTWNGQAGAPEVILDITRGAGATLNLLSHVFPNTWANFAAGDCNVRDNTAGTISMWDWTGAFGGENNDCDTTGGEVIWKGGAGGASGSGTSGYPAIY